MKQKIKSLNTLYKNIHQEIIDQCREGSQKAQFQLYKLYYKAMYSVSLRIVNDSMEAEDVMQESFLSAFNKIESYKGEVSFGAWLKRIVVNRSLDYLKKRKVQFEEVNERTAQIAEYQMETRDIDAELLKRAIQQLSDGYRVVLSLYLIEGYDHEEISQILGISNSASRTQLLRAKNKLKELLKGKEIFSYN
ncbi:sigma-70 family RNA polymerase sigma factor [uncultured Draconibacterium sp.]|uniref:RNA polymerase sigma factor n=1 Tax=uncultured Draconibacterium sp. TaxID=1573823 RepID=UPI002AA6F447|nr:sigma-70 family RNA polymerase sigma factor [uncultured Draconibacterium sp.]